MAIPLSSLTENLAKWLQKGKCENVTPVLSIQSHLDPNVWAATKYVRQSLMRAWQKNSKTQIGSVMETLTVCLSMWVHR